MVLGQKYRTRMLLVCPPPCCFTTSLTKLAAEASGAMWENPFTIAFGDFSIHAEAASYGLAWGFVVSMSTMELSQYINAPTYVAGHGLGLVIAIERISNILLIGGPTVSLLSWTDHSMVSFGLNAAILQG